MKPMISSPTALLLAAVCLTAGCSEERWTVRFGAPEDLLPPPEDPGAPIVTANVEAVTGPEGVRLLVSEPLAGQVLLLEGCGDGCSVRPLVSEIGRPVRTHAAAARDGGLEVLIADIGVLEATETSAGRILAVNDGGRSVGTATPLLGGLGRIARATQADLDGDGDEDLLAAVFGALQGELIWAERLEDGTYTRRVIEPLSGAADAFAFDADGDGDLDVAAPFSQEHEELNLYRNDGRGSFTKELLLAGGDPCYGLSSIAPADLDRDGDVDLLVTNGDDMDPECHGPYYGGQHGLDWLENDGRGGFRRREIVGSYGAYAVQAADLDGDGDVDLALASYQWSPDYQPVHGWSPLVWLENDGEERFTSHRIDPAPASVITAALADVDGDGLLDIVAGSMNGERPIPGARRLAVLRAQREPR